MVIVGVMYYFYKDTFNEFSADLNLNTDDNYNYNFNYNYNTNYDANANTDTINANSEKEPSEITTTPTSGEGEVIDDDGVSLGFEAEPISADLYAYQVGAYSGQRFSDTGWPALRITLDYPEVPPLTDADDIGSLWVGVVLDNDYFIQVGMMSSTEADTQGNMRWNYFWQMWDDQDNYKYGLQEPMENYGWEANDTNQFTLTCQDPETGTWEFWVNDTVVGRTDTESCALDIYNSQVFWEMTTPKTANADLPTFGPFTFSDFEYWDGYDWQSVQSATLSYGYGQILAGTDKDQASVCPPYGAVSDSANKTFQAGTNLPCSAIDSVLWE